NAVKSSPVGAYSINITPRDIPNYNVSYMSGTLEIKAVPNVSNPKQPSQVNSWDTVISTPDRKVLLAVAPSQNQVYAVDAALEKAKISVPDSNKKVLDLQVVNNNGNVVTGNQRILLPYKILGNGINQNDTYSISHLRSDGVLETYSGNQITKTSLGLEITASSFSPFVVC
ncbi:MAG: hypothetical protein RR315_07665, partial [Oscillospiraceae bacterium]